MAEYIVKNRETGEILVKGTRDECAKLIGCDPAYLKKLVTKKPEYTNCTYSKYQDYLVECEGERKPGGAHMGNVVCKDCGTLMINVGILRQRCKECARKRNLDMRKSYMREVRNSKLALPATTKNEKKDGCEGCIYYGGYYPVSRCCNYIFIMGEQRPCPPGKDCTVREEKSDG